LFTQTLVAILNRQYNRYFKMNRHFYIFIIVLFTTNVFGQTDTLKKSSVEPKTELERVEVINKSFDDFVKLQTEKKKEDRSIWDTLIPLLIGAGLTLATQILMDFRKNRKEKKSDILLTKAELEKLKYLLKDNYRELAMHKAHKFYWYAHYEFESAKEKPDDKEVDKFYNFHMNSSSKARDTENKISDNFAEYCKQVSKLQHLTGFNENVKTFIREFQEFKPQKPKDLVAEEQSDLYKHEREEEDRLFAEYQKFIEIIEKINNELE
jgi:hypothetical protein